MRTTVIFLIGTVLGIILTFLFSKNYFEQKISEQIKINSELQTKYSDLEKNYGICSAKLKILSPWSEEVLAAPEFASSVPKKLETNRMGEVKINWVAVEGAKKTLIVLTDKDGSVVKTYSSPKDTLYLKDIPTPQDAVKTLYSIHLQSVNGNDEKGPAGEVRPLIVHPYARISAPAIEEILIED